MLDEILEYDQYSADPKTIKNPRLKYGTLTADFCGLTRALTIIARYALFDKYAGLSCDEKFTGTVDELRQWCGKWLPSYISDCLMHITLENDDEKKCKMKTARLEKTLAKLEKKQAEFEHDELSKEQYTNNTEKKITYGNIVRNAAGAGALKRYFLVSAKPIEWSCAKKRTRTGQKNLRLSHQDIILKTIANYLLKYVGSAREEVIPQRFVMVSWTDIKNWSMVNLNSGAELLKEYSWSDKPLFLLEEHGQHRSYTKIRINESFMNEYKWQLIEEEELTDFMDSHHGYVVYRDEGAGLPLAKVDTSSLQAEVDLY